MRPLDAALRGPRHGGLRGPPPGSLTREGTQFICGWNVDWVLILLWVCAASFVLFYWCQGQWCGWVVCVPLFCFVLFSLVLFCFVLFCFVVVLLVVQCANRSFVLAGRGFSHIVCCFFDSILFPWLSFASFRVTELYVVVFCFCTSVVVLFVLSC